MYLRLPLSSVFVSSPSYKRSNNILNIAPVLPEKTHRHPSHILLPLHLLRGPSSIGGVSSGVPFSPFLPFCLSFLFLRCLQLADGVATIAFALVTRTSEDTTDLHHITASSPPFCVSLIRFHYTFVTNTTHDIPVLYISSGQAAAVAPIPALPTYLSHYPLSTPRTACSTTNLFAN